MLCSVLLLLCYAVLFTMVAVLIEIQLEDVYKQPTIGEAW